MKKRQGKIIRTEIDDIYDAGKRDMAINLYKSGMSADAIANAALVSLDTVKIWLADKNDSDQGKVIRTAMDDIYGVGIEKGIEEGKEEGK